MVANLFRKKTVLITGGGTGLGSALAKKLAFDKADIIIVGRRLDKLEEVVEDITNNKKKSGKIIAVQGDISTKDGLAAVMTGIKKTGLGVDILINNAAVYFGGKFEQLTQEEVGQIISTNIWGSIMLTHLLIDQILANKRSGIINISSFAGKVGLPFQSVYSASKYALAGFTESLQREYAGKLNILGVYPSGIKTDFMGSATKKLEKMKFNFNTPDVVAEKIIEAYNLQKKSLILGKKEKSFIFWNKFNSKSVDKSFQKLKGQILSAVNGASSEIGKVFKKKK